MYAHLIAPRCLSFCSSCFSPASWSSILDSMGLLCRFSGAFSAFLLSPWPSSLYILALSASLVSDLKPRLSKTAVLQVGCASLCCGPDPASDQKPEQSDDIPYLSCISWESQSCTGTCPTSEHSCFLHLVQICIVYGRKTILILVLQP